MGWNIYIYIYLWRSGHFCVPLCTTTVSSSCINFPISILSLFCVCCRHRLFSPPYQVARRKRCPQGYPRQSMSQFSCRTFPLHGTCRHFDRVQGSASPLLVDFYRMLLLVFTGDRSEEDLRYPQHNIFTSYLFL